MGHNKNKSRQCVYSRTSTFHEVEKIARIFLHSSVLEYALEKFTQVAIKKLERMVRGT